MFALRTSNSKGNSFKHVKNKSVKTINGFSESAHSERFSFEHLDINPNHSLKLPLPIPDISSIKLPSNDNLLSNDRNVSSNNNQISQTFINQINQEIGCIKSGIHFKVKKSVLIYDFQSVFSGESFSDIYTGKDVLHMAYNGRVEFDELGITMMQKDDVNSEEYYVRTGQFVGLIKKYLFLQNRLVDKKYTETNTFTRTFKLGFKLKAAQADKRAVCYVNFVDSLEQLKKVLFGIPYSNYYDWINSPLPIHATTVVATITPTAADSVASATAAAFSSADNKTVNVKKSVVKNHTTLSSDGVLGLGQQSGHSGLPLVTPTASTAAAVSGDDGRGRHTISSFLFPYQQQSSTDTTYTCVVPLQQSGHLWSSPLFLSSVTPMTHNIDILLATSNITTTGHTPNTLTNATRKRHIHVNSPEKFHVVEKNEEDSPVLSVQQPQVPSSGINQQLCYGYQHNHNYGNSHNNEIDSQMYICNGGNDSSSRRSTSNDDNDDESNAINNKMKTKANDKNSKQLKKLMEKISHLQGAIDNLQNHQQKQQVSKYQNPLSQKKQKQNYEHQRQDATVMIVSEKSSNTASPSDSISCMNNHTDSVSQLSMEMMKTKTTAAATTAVNVNADYTSSSSSSSVAKDVAYSVDEEQAINSLLTFQYNPCEVI